MRCGDEYGWRYVFGVNVPLGAVALITAPLFLRGRTDAVRLRARADWLGMLLLTAGLVALLVPLIQGQENDWPWWTFASLVLSSVILVVFFLWERRVESTGGSPFLPPHLLAKRAFNVGLILAAVYFAALPATSSPSRSCGKPASDIAPSLTVLCCCRSAIPRCRPTP